MRHAALPHHPWRVKFLPNPLSVVVVIAGCGSHRKAGHYSPTEMSSFRTCGRSATSDELAVDGPVVARTTQPTTYLTPPSSSFTPFPLPWCIGQQLGQRRGLVVLDLAQPFRQRVA
jgi:hypothetical protein